MHYKKNIYAKGIHIKMIWKNNILKAKVYNYSGNVYSVFYQQNKFFNTNKENIRPKEEMNQYILIRKPLIITQEIQESNLINKDLFLNIHITDENENEIIIDEFNQTITDYFILKFEKNIGITR